MNQPDASTLFDAALKSYEKSDWTEAHRLSVETLRLDPRHAQALHLAGVLELKDGNAVPALARLRLAVALAPHHGGIRRSLGMAHAALKQWEESLQAYREALRLGTVDAGLLFEMGVVQHELRDWEGAIVSFREYVKLEPKNALGYNNLASTLNRIKDYAGAAAAYESARAIDPKNLEVLANLATLYEQMNELEKAKLVAHAGLALSPDHDLLHLVMARLERRGGQAGKAITRLIRLVNRPAMDARACRSMHFELGRDYDHIGEFDLAYRHFSAGNRIATEIWPDMMEGSRDYLAELDSQLADSDEEALRELANKPKPRDPRAPIFLVSFPRSGTTLMDTMLGIHPKVVVMEEEPPLYWAHVALIERRGPTLRAIADLTEVEVEELRAFYWTETERLLGPQATTSIVVDKNPFYSQRIPFIHRLFPEARFIFALRHPCAVVLSCFMQPFGRNPVLANFTDLVGSAQTYRRIMSLWLFYRRHLPLRVHELRYESLVKEKGKTLRTALSFLDLEWDENMSDHVAHARGRGRIYTPSYHQVSEPIYADAVDRWRNYEKYLSAVGGLLQHFVTEFGYDTSD